MGLFSNFPNTDSPGNFPRTQSNHSYYVIILIVVLLAILGIIFMMTKKSS